MTTNASRVGHQNGEFVPGRFEKCRADTESPHSVPGGVKDAGHDCHFNQEEFSIGQILEEKGRSFTFDYDFGDGWEHEVRLSSVSEYADGEPRKIRFVSCKRACPPEDCGGLWGYDELCGIVRKKASGKRLTRDERERLEWYSGDYDDCFDPDLLDLDACADAAEALND